LFIFILYRSSIHEHSLTDAEINLYDITTSTRRGKEEEVVVIVVVVAVEEDEEFTKRYP